MKLYAISILAVRFNQTHIAHSVLVTNHTRSDDEAVGFGIRRAREKWNAEDGWGGHAANALRVSDEFIDAAYDQPEPDQDENQEETP